MESELNHMGVLILFPKKVQLANDRIQKKARLASVIILATGSVAWVFYQRWQISCLKNDFIQKGTAISLPPQHPYFHFVNASFVKVEQLLFWQQTVWFVL